MLEQKYAAKTFLLAAVRSFEEDIDSLEEQIYTYCEQLCSHFAMLYVQAAPFRTIASEVRHVMDIARASGEYRQRRSAAEQMLETYLQMEHRYRQKIDEARQKQEVYREALVDLTLDLPIRRHPKSHKCIIYTPGSNGGLRRVKMNLYLASIEDDNPVPYEAGSPGFLMRRMMRLDGRLSDADVHYLQNMSKKIEPQEVLCHAVQQLQTEFDAREPRIADQREKVRPHMRYDPRKMRELHAENRQSWRDILIDYITSPLFQEP